MKKNLILLAACLLGVKSIAQITITLADIAKPPQNFYLAMDNEPAISIGTAGANKKWDMRMLQTHTIDTVVFLVPGSTPYKTNFPTANLAYKTTSDTSYSYLTTSASSLLLNGIKTNTSITTYSPAEISIPFPLVYNKKFTNNYIKDYKITEANGDVLRTKSKIVKTTTADAWGNITTPQGNFNCLRMSEKVHQQDSVFVKVMGKWYFGGTSVDSSKVYTWWANNIGFPILVANVNYVNDSVESASWLKLSGTVGINENVPAVDITIYPNPAQYDVKFKLDANQATALQIFDVAGRIVYSTIITVELTTVSVSKFANGTYNYVIIGKENSIVNRGKFNVIK